MLRSKYISLFNKALVFLFIFSIYNDNFVVNYAGDNSLKFIFLLFALVNIAAVYKNLITPEIIKEMKYFLIFTGILILMMLINPHSGGLTGQQSASNMLLVISLVFIVGFFISYDLSESLYAIWTSLLVSSVIAVFNEPLTEFTFRKTGGTGDPNEFAAQMLSFLFISIFLYRHNKNIYFLSSSIIAFLYSILHAASMSSFVALPTLILFVLLRYLSLSFKKSLLISSAALVLLIAGLFVFQDKLKDVQLFSNILKRTENLRTYDSRVRNWKAGVKMIIDEPITGVGFGEYASNTYQYSNRRLTKDSVAPHNIYVHIFAESGLFAFIAFMTFLYLLLKKNFKKIMQSDYFWLYMSVLSYLVMGFTLGFTYNKFPWLTFALLLNVHYKIWLQNPHLLIAFRENQLNLIEFFGYFVRKRLA